VSARPLPFGEFVALMGVLFATIAFSIDAMLPALPEIAAELTPGAVNNAQLVLTSFVLGMGAGTFLAGPLSDRFGRKPVILAGAAIYIAAAVAAWQAPTLEALLAARVVQGIGASGPRVVTLAMMRDLYSGRQMARVMSLAMMVFVLVPAVAPAIGQVIIGFFDWRAIFLAFVIFSLMSGAWLALRQPETHPPERRLSLEPARLLGALAEVTGSRVVMIYTAVLSLTFGILFAVLSATQPIFDVSFGRAESFPAWFAAIALASGTASLVNAALVVRLGMRRMVLASFTALVGLSALAAAATALGILGTAAAFPAHILWTTAVFFSAGMTIGNLNALALEPMGHIAGLASSAVGAISTVLGVAIAVPIGLAFDGTPLPLYLGVLATASLALVLVRTSPKATEVSI